MKHGKVMAYKKINTLREALSIGNKPGEVKSVGGYLLSARYGVGKKGKNKGNTLFTIQAKSGAVDLWGNASTIGAFCDSHGKLVPALQGCLIKVVFVKMGKKQPGKNPQKICDVFVDDSKRINAANGGKDYVVKQ